MWPAGGTRGEYISLELQLLMLAKLWAIPSETKCEWQEAVASLAQHSLSAGLDPHFSFRVSLGIRSCRCNELVVRLCERGLSSLNEILILLIVVVCERTPKTSPVSAPFRGPSQLAIKA